MATTRRRRENEIDWGSLRHEAAQRFGIVRFRPGQRELIEAVLRGKNALGILPTGAGKSLCYQLPAFVLDGAVVVVSPLIALMQDQHDHLSEAEIEAARLDSTVRGKEQRSRESALAGGAYDVVLVTPERLQDPEHVGPLKARGVALFVVDEAHCVVQWGHDFRPAYVGLRPVIDELGRPPVLALTATAPQDVAEEILKGLGIEDAVIIHTGIERENLFLKVQRTPTEAAKEEALIEYLEGSTGSAIVYAATVRRVNELHAWLLERGVSAARYHGKLRHSEREKAHEEFMSGAVRLMVATNAFGLGVDKADVRAVIHWNFPESVESYYQEAGRAGRDGKASDAILFYRLEDKRIRSFFLGGKHPTRDEALRFLGALVHHAQGGARPTLQEIVAASGLNTRRASVLAATLEAMEIVERRGRVLRLRRDYAPDEVERFLDTFESRHRSDRERLEAIMRYGQSTDCRMQYLRKYFGEPAGEPCNHCDNCGRPVMPEPIPESVSFRAEAPFH
jgi:ATP-dependent DNA helicase RecQ